jgi:hypothetical protein
MRGSNRLELASLPTAERRARRDGPVDRHEVIGEVVQVIDDTWVERGEQR